MKVTVILKDFTEIFYEGFGESIKGLNQMDNMEKFQYCKKLHGDKRATMKIATGQFRDAVEFNSMMRDPVKIEFKIEPRKGYKLATFEITKV
jgi:hypothetical protein